MKFCSLSVPKVLRLSAVVLSVCCFDCFTKINSGDSYFIRTVTELSQRTLLHYFKQKPERSTTLVSPVLLLRHVTFGLLKLVSHVFVHTTQPFLAARNNRSRAKLGLPEGRRDPCCELLNNVNPYVNRRRTRHEHFMSQTG